jgi:hypothetical protein
MIEACVVLLENWMMNYCCGQGLVFCALDFGLCALYFVLCTLYFVLILGTVLIGSGIIFDASG